VALHRGPYLAASSSLAAASEAAWLNLARAVKQPGAKLQGLIESGRDIAEVIRLTEQHLTEIRVGRSLITEIVSQAHLFRESGTTRCIRWRSTTRIARLG
jgi:hypothetical protein